MRLHNKEFLLSVHMQNVLKAQLTDVLIAYCYEFRSQSFELTSESSWTINKLSYTLSCFVDLDDVKQSLLCSVRRQLVFPIYRNYEFARQVVRDAILILGFGRRFIVKVLLEIKVLFEKNEPYYLLNTLYIDDFIIWVQNLKEESV